MVFSVFTVPLKSLLHYRTKIKTVRWQGEPSNQFHLSCQHVQKRGTDWFSSSGMREVPIAVHCSRRSAFSGFMPNSSLQTRKEVVNTWVWQIEARLLWNRDDAPGHQAHGSYHWASHLQIWKPFVLIMFCKHAE